MRRPTAKPADKARIRRRTWILFIAVYFGRRRAPEAIIKAGESGG